MGLVCLQPPLVEPVSLEELKQFLRIDLDDIAQDDTILSLALDARAFCETFIARKCVQQTWRLLMDFFPGYIDLKLAGTKVSSPFVSGSNAVLVGIRYAIVLPYPPVQSIVQFQYQNANGMVTSMTPSTDYTQDLVSNPARLTPPFGAMWPVARVVVNAINVDYVVGYANPISLAATANSATVTATGYLFVTTDIGREISIPGAGPGGTTLNSIVLAVPGAPSASATLRDKALTTISATMGLIVNTPSAKPGHWAKIKRGIKVMTNGSYERRLPRQELEDTVQKILWPVRDFRY